MNSVLATGNDICWLKMWQIFQPKAGCFCFTMPKHPGLDDLIRFADSGTDNADRIFECNVLDRCVQEQAYEVEGIFLFLPLVLEPPGATDGQMGARGMGNHEIPAIAEDVRDVTLMVGTGAVGREEITAHGVMAKGKKGIPDSAGILAGNQNFQLKHLISGN